MAASWQRVTGAVARAAIAERLRATRVRPRLGSVLLEPHQVSAAERVLRLLQQHGGALLADDVGLGKTFVALAVAARYERVLVVHPAALRTMWRSASDRAGVRPSLASYEALSRGSGAQREWQLVILDEAHHARSRDARRYARIADLTAHAHVVLLSATPVPNRLDELHALLALFLGERSTTLDDASLRELIVRRTSELVPGATLPPVDEVRWIDVADDDEVLGHLLALPPPVPLADGGAGGTLLTWGLMRLWASSHAALAAGIRRRIARASALADSLAVGRYPTRRELASWALTDAAMQLGMPELLSDVAPPGSDAGDAGALLDTVRAHLDGLQRVAARLREQPWPDQERAALLATLRARHRGAKVLAFTEFAETAQAYWRALRTEPGAAVLTARGGCIASGRASRADILRRFAPDGQRCARPRSIEDISLLVTTDLLAEGVDLRDATVIVHLDLPWSPARLEQRVGRARRLGSHAEAITVYAFRPPRTAEALLTMEARLRAKVATAQATVGWARTPHSPAERHSALLDRVAGWRVDGRECHAAGCAVATLHASAQGWLALVSVGRTARLVACIDGAIDDAPEHLERAVCIAEGAPDAAGLDATAADRGLAEALRWAAARTAEASIAPPPPSGITRRLLDRIARIDAAMSHERRAACATLLAHAREVATAPHGAGIEQGLDALLRADARDGAEWLRAITDAGQRPVAYRSDPGVEVLVLFGPDA